MPSDPKHSSGDQAAAQQRFLSLFLRSEREVFRYVAALVPNVADAEDIVQETALTLWEKFDAYDPSKPFTPWACRFALNKARQWIERRQRWQALLSEGLAQELASRREELRPEFERHLRHLDGCLGQLSEDQQTLVEGYYHRRTGIEALAGESGRRCRRSLSRNWRNSTKSWPASRLLRVDLPASAGRGNPSRDLSNPARSRSWTSSREKPMERFRHDDDVSAE